MRGIRPIRKFGGKSYHYHITFGDKVGAQKMVDAYKRAGDRVRMVRSSHGFHIYVRSKKTPAWAA